VIRQERSLNAQQGLNGTPFTLQYTCSICGRPQSSRYQAQHPLAPREISCPGVCSRCTSPGHSAPLTGSASRPEFTTYEIHHYYHICSCMTISCSSTGVPLAELPGEPGSCHRAELSEISQFPPTPKACRQPSLATIIEEDSPPPVQTWSIPSPLNPAGRIVQQ